MEYLDILDSEDKVIGNATRKEVYDKKLTHRIVHVLLFSKENKIYLQRRSEKVSYLPGYYCTSAGGHVLSGESYEEAARRELKEEIGIDSQIKEIAKFDFQLDGQNRFIKLFIANADSEINFSDGEVASGSFYTIEEAKQLWI